MKLIIWLTRTYLRMGRLTQVLLLVGVAFMTVGLFTTLWVAVFGAGWFVAIETAWLAAQVRSGRASAPVEMPHQPLAVSR